MKRIKEMINKGVASLWGVAGTVLFGASYAILSYTDTYLFGKDYLPEPVPIPGVNAPTPTELVIGFFMSHLLEIGIIITAVWMGYMVLTTPKRRERRSKT